ncbi:MAG: aminotransferase class III-fold pyridoxal phosphate-dependent enzyme [Alphaproteobacteria bacterium]|nr:aminotransferase class III-fold pyridoxal phosphate-dependent enzyme [Alphaproteobacteria bacterium]
MPDTGPTNSRITAAYREKTPGSAKLAREAAECFPSGITHDSRYLLPYGIYVSEAKGAHKRDVDGNDYVDYYGGHGALLLGHNRPEVLAEIQAALAQGTHFGANHSREVAWAQWVKKLVPAAERLRFTSSGTEATLMALRLARAFTGRTKVVRLKTHFHGWHDHMASGVTNHFDGTPAPGVLAGVADGVLLLPPGDLEAARVLLASDKDIAGLILEPTGASFGLVPITADYVAGLRELTAKHGVVLIFDEVVTGFRVSPGGAQAHYGIVPDLSCHAKILAGGLPGGALVGRKAILDALDFEVSRTANREKVQHQGTFNANPVSAAAGAKTLEIIGTSDACARANDYGERLRAGLNRMLAEEKMHWAAYGTFSGFHIYLNQDRRADVKPETFDPLTIPYDTLKNAPQALVHKLHLALIVNGVDIPSRPGGIVSATHSEADLAHTIHAFREAVRMLRADGEI